MRLDRYDSYLTSFHASITEVREDSGGLWLRLDRSAFYPTAGGQLNDTGTISLAGRTLTVVDVKASEGAVWHLVEGAGSPPPEVGDELSAQLDWKRRYRHMQRHTGQHILSQALVRVSEDYGTRSVAMRGPDCTIDFGGAADLRALAAVELEANRAARQALPIMTFAVHDSRLSEYRLRRPPKVSGQVRLVSIGDYDLVACGGTHLRSSAEALPIKITGLESVKGGTNRLTFRAGEEALADYALKHEVTSRLGASLSLPVGGILDRITQLQDELEEQKRALSESRRSQASALAARVLADAQNGCVTAYLEGDDAKLLEQLIDHLQHARNTVSLLAAAEAGSNRVRFAFLAGPDANADVRPLLTAVLQPLGGRGGGRPDRAQGAAEARSDRVRAALDSAAAQLAGQH